jgi:TolB-like protein/tetratricopeptide (TPR) repeat protein
VGKMPDAGAGAGAPIDLGRCADSAIGPLCLRPSLCEVEYGGATEKLEPRVMQVLVALSRAQGRLVSRNDLIESCWGGAIVGDDAINRVLVRLRRLLAKTGGAVEIETVRSLGYRLLVTDAGQVSAPSAPRLGFTRASWFAYAGVALGALALLLLAHLALTPAPPRDRLAVLAFRTEDASLQGYAETMAERIRGALSIGDLNTLARVNSASYRSDAMARQAGRDGVGFVLDGVIAHEGEDLLVLVQVIEPRSNLALWTQEYRRAASDDLWLEQQIAAHAVEILRCALITRRSPARRISGEVLGAFMRACDRVQQFEAGGSDMLAAARELTRQAPRFSKAWSMLAMASAMAAQNAPPERSAALRTEAEAAAARAIRLDRENGEALLARALLLARTRFAERDALLTRAIAIEPTLSDAHVLRAFFLMETGRVSEALAELRDAVALDPLAPANWAALLPVLSANGQEAEARELRQRLLEVWPHSPAAQFNVFKNRMFNGAPHEALAMLDEGAVELRPQTQRAVRTFLQAQAAEDRARVRAAVLHLARLARQGAYDLPSTISSASMSGELDLAFELGEVYLAGSLDGVSPATPARGATSHFMFLSPTENLRRDPRFIRLAAQAGLLEYWLQSGAWPDFCRRRDLGYNCENEARTLDPARRR